MTDKPKEIDEIHQQAKGSEPVELTPEEYFSWARQATGNSYFKGGLVIKFPPGTVTDD